MGIDLDKLREEGEEADFDVAAAQLDALQRKRQGIDEVQQKKGKAGERGFGGDLQGNSVTNKLVKRREATDSADQFVNQVRAET